MNRTKVILSIFLMLFLLLAGLVLPSFWKSQKKEASGNKGREPATLAFYSIRMKREAPASSLFQMQRFCFPGYRSQPNVPEA